MYWAPEELALFGHCKFAFGYSLYLYLHNPQYCQWIIEWSAKIFKFNSLLTISVGFDSQWNFGKMIFQHHLHHGFVSKTFLLTPLHQLVHVSVILPFFIWLIYHILLLKSTFRLSKWINNSYLLLVSDSSSKSLNSGLGASDWGGVGCIRKTWNYLNVLNLT